VAPVVPGAADAAHGDPGVASHGPQSSPSMFPLSPTPEVAELQQTCSVDHVERLMRMWLRDQLQLRVQVRNSAQPDLGKLDTWIDGSLPRYLNVCDYLTKQYPAGAPRESFADQLRELEGAVQRASQARADSYLLKVPEVPGCQDERRPVASVHGAPGAACQVAQTSFVFRGRLWQLSFQEDGCARGPSVTFDILELVTRHLASAKGNCTEDYPLRLKFARGVEVHDAVQNFSINFAVGFGAQLACFLIAHALIHRSHWCPWSQEELLAVLGWNLLKVFRFSATASKTGSAMSEARQSLGEKFQASTRSRPNPVQIFYSVQRVYLEQLSTGDGVPGAPGDAAVTAAYKGIIAAFNKVEKTKANRISKDEETCVLLIARCTRAVREKLMARTSDPSAIRVYPVCL